MQYLNSFFKKIWLNLTVFILCFGFGVYLNHCLKQPKPACYDKVIVELVEDEELVALAELAGPELRQTINYFNENGWKVKEFNYSVWDEDQKRLVHHTRELFKFTRTR